MKPRTTDHRGRRVRLAMPEALRAAGVDLRDIKVPPVGFVPGASFARGELHWTFIALLAFYLPLAGAVVMLLWDAGAPPWLIGPGIIGAYLLSWWPMRHWWWLAIGESYVGRVIEAERCPSCTFSLEALTVEADGCRVCPECGSAWRGRNEEVAGEASASAAAVHEESPDDEPPGYRG